MSMLERFLKPFRAAKQPMPESFFFLRLPNGQYGPVSQLSCPEKSKEAKQIHSPGGGSLDARPPVVNTNRPGARARAAFPVWGKIVCLTHWWLGEA